MCIDFARLRARPAVRHCARDIMKLTRSLLYTGTGTFEWSAR